MPEPLKIPLIGHDRLIAFFRQATKRDRLAHAYLLVGPESVGKAALAKDFAAQLLGETAPERHPDFILVERGRDPKTGKLHGDIVLAQVQALRARLSLGALLAGWKVCLIDGADCLNTESANALLKTLEEPTAKTLLLLTAESRDGVMPTVRSRCQEIRCGRVPTQAIQAGLEASGAASAQAALAARLADGRPGRAITYLSQPMALDALLELRQALLRLAQVGIAERWSLAEKLIPAKLPFQETVERVAAVLDLSAELIRDALRTATDPAADRLIHADIRADIAAWATKAGRPRLIQALAQTIESKKMLADNVNPKAVLDQFVLSLS